MRRFLGLGFVASSAFVLALYGCSSSSSDDSSGDDTSDSGNDATTQDVSVADTGAPIDSGILDGNVIDANVDAGPPHIAFVTTASFTGNLIGAANAADAGTVSLDGGAFTDYVSASNALCMADAKRAGRSGKFVALVQAGTDDMFARIADSDGPWALPDGTPIADTVAALKAGDMHAAIDETITGTRVVNESYTWSKGATGDDCNGWTSEVSGSTAGNVGIAGFISPYAYNGANQYCSSVVPLYCLEVGSGGGPNHYSAVPAGGKIAFLAVGPYANNFTLPDAGVLDAAAPTSGDVVHEVGDAICSELAAGAGQTGEFHAWLSSSTTAAGAYFTGLSMNGPWYRADGIQIASSLSDLTTTGARTQIAFDAAGHFPASFGPVKTGTKNDGTSANANCSDFTSATTGGVASGYATNKLGLWTESDGFQCTLNSAIYCFQK